MQAHTAHVRNCDRPRNFPTAGGRVESAPFRTALHRSLPVELNPQQRAAVHHLEGPLLVLAGAGSGKTGVITRKIAWLLRECGYRPRQVLAVTFTNKAAREMRERVRRLLADRPVRGLRIGTFHALGLEILRTHPQALGYRAGFSIFDTHDSLHQVAEIVRKARLHLEPEHARWQIGAWKNEAIDPEAALAGAESDREVACARVYAAYQDQLRAYNALDFDDLLLQPVRLFETHPELLEAWRERIRYLLVDEYQDTNPAQYRLVRLLSGPLGAFTVVGDDDQSIYAWRGARPENLARLAEDYPRLTVIKLEQNYRSTGIILRAANRLIAHNPHVFEKRLWSRLGQGERIRVLSCRDPEHEAERIVSEILHRRFQERARDGDFAILYRGNHQSRPFEQALRAHRIPYHVSGGTSFFDYTEVKDLVAYLRLLVNEDDDRAFLRCVNTPRREIGAATLEKLAAYAGERGIGLLAACFEAGLAQRLPARARHRLEGFATWIAAQADRARRGDPVAVFRDLVEEIDYRGWLESQAKTPEEAGRRWENVEELFEWMERTRAALEGEASLAELVARMSLMDLLDRKDADADGDRVHLMTLHAAKGLEFPHVFIVGMEEGLLPHRSAIESGDLTEERRLAYVGITRARRTLTFSLAARRRVGGQWSETEPSRFLQELPEEDLVWEGGRCDARPPEERRARGRAHLANLKALLEDG
ncbi:MAG: ATP-dependent DNA helicase Rep [Gammaproteobacteria bacterium]|nr:MAG: ATP-dependent DNA helicase Rep [Gammaproteobacteria bacterium]